FTLTGFAEQSGHGVPVIVARYGRKAFSFSDGMLKVTIPFSFEPDPVNLRKYLSSPAIPRLSEKQFRILRYLAENPTSTLSAAAEKEDMSLAWAKKIVAVLQSMSILARVGSKKAGEWRVDPELLEYLENR
ncbi:MAG: hypothetical protein J6X41_04215, partial [Spirochaetales bacterium]|nr:hypothetical protein [Spirochaetales bacterium]